MNRSAANAYSRHWFSVFHQNISEEKTRLESRFIASQAPLSEFRRVLDVCCGMGRHARALCAQGYAVTGVERDAAAIARARELAASPVYIQADVRDFRPEKASFDAAIIMSQSFGYFDVAANEALLQRLATGLRMGGRLILDLWNAEFFMANQGAHDVRRPEGIIRGTQQVVNGRLLVRLVYPEGNSDDFDWQLFKPDEIVSLAHGAGFDLVRSCADFDAAIVPFESNPKIQFIFELRDTPAPTAVLNRRKIH